ncbi:hypothetical protein [Pumilibacter muris]|uniref:hypothetical protein n=1 Tax=Pumilibacter muris TaxID=2941510 RepID=UPI00203B467D|nr:hypothetical protein [Pumilibacter muris]
MINGIYDDGMGNALGTGASLPAAELVWLMFAQTGMPGLYMLYSDLNNNGERERSILD